MGSKDWLSLFPDTGIKHYPIQISDNAPIEVDLNLTRSGGKSPFKIDAWALDYEDCLETVRKIKWEDFDQKLEHGMNLACSGGGDEEYSRVNEEVREFAKAAAMFWKQRAKVKWMVDGDTCTKFFFNWVKGRAGQNHIHGLKGEDGEWCYEEELDEVDRLDKPFTAKEVRGAVFQMGAFKAPGPDGIPACFYQKCWSMIKDEFTSAVLSILNYGRVLKEVRFLGIGFTQIWFSPEAGKAHYELRYYSEL
ncbi:uncharacterized protein LOC141649030 [Silene latifolia]|uniref:uncharacterized protein LOC141649030 n=1 Tax=Silene latifolia TaxID=37657 RepID=UPI003D777A9A